MKRKKWLYLTINVLSLVLTSIVLLLIVSLVLEMCPFLVGANYSVKGIGYSMFPARRPGDMALVRKGIEDIQVGDIICFRKGLELISHRVTDIQIYPDIIFETKGDANKISDGWVEANSVAGKEILVLPLGLFVTRNVLFLIIILIIIMILVRIFYFFSEEKQFQCLLVNSNILSLIAILAFSLDCEIFR